MPAFSFSYDVWTVKLNTLGTIDWQKVYGGLDTDQINDITPTNDGGYILSAGSNSDATGVKTVSNKGNQDYWIIKTDYLGNIVWQKGLGGSDYEGLAKIKQTSDGGYIISGVSASSISGDKTETLLGFQDYWVIKLDASGSILWQNTIGSTNEIIHLRLSKRMMADMSFVVTLMEE